jgi:glyceraldehyde 3-phosphate dehydrogenase
VIRVGINGFGRMGRLAVRAAWDSPDFEFAHINELHGDAEVAAHLLMFDSVHGRWDRQAVADGDHLVIDGRRVSYSRAQNPDGPLWADLGIDVVVECSGKFRTMDALESYFGVGVRRVVVAAPVKDDRARVPP